MLGLDELLNKEEIERHIRKRLSELFEPKCDLLLSDITCTNFESEMDGCPIAERGFCGTRVATALKSALD